METVMERTRSQVIVRTEFEALHCWPECPFADVSFLKNPHRHKFYVEARFITTEDRQLEFFMVKTRLDTFIKSNFAGRDLGRSSCEVIASKIANALDAQYVSVFEDNENGASYEREIIPVRT